MPSVGIAALAQATEASASSEVPGSAAGDDDNEVEEADGQTRGPMERLLMRKISQKREGLDTVRTFLFGANRHATPGDFLARAREALAAQHTELNSRIRTFAEQKARGLGQKEARAAVEHMDEAHEWRIGSMEVAAFTLSINGQVLGLGSDGWTMRGFCGTDAHLMQRLLFGANVVNTLEGTVASLEGSKAFNLDHVAVHELGLAAKMLKDSSAAVALHKSARVRSSVDSFVEITGAKANELKEKVAEKVAVAEQGLRDAKVGLAMALEETKDGIAKDGIAKGVWGFGERFVKHVRDAQSPTAAP